MSSTTNSSITHPFTFNARSSPHSNKHTNTNSDNNGTTCTTATDSLTSIYGDGESHSISTVDIQLYNDIVDASYEHPYILEGVNVIIDSISRYKLEHCALSFNGGKDCTVLLHLLRAALGKLGMHISDLTILYFKVENEFVEIEEFMAQCGNLYNLHLTTVEGNFCNALQLIFAERKAGHLPDIRAIFMGQRRYDPYCMDMTTETASDEQEGWPAFHRINVLLDWTYEQIWQFLRLFDLPYCRLYDEGYTSIGNTLDSVPNPLLYDASTQSYKAAYHLQDDSKERCGRKEKERTPSRSASIANGVHINGIKS